MAKRTTPSYISALLKPMPGRATDRRVWSVPLQGVWLPFFTATNVAGETALDAEVLGATIWKGWQVPLGSRWIILQAPQTTPDS